jgi:hypothetical protein
MKFISSTLIIIFFFVNDCLSSNLDLKENSTIRWSSKEGLARLNSSQYKNDFYQMAEHFQPQINPLYCAIASSVIVLNTLYEGQKINNQRGLEVIKPKAFGGGIIPFNSYSQLTFLNKITDKVKDQKIITLQNITQENENNTKNFDAGLSLKQLDDILKTYQLKTEIHYAKAYDQRSLESFREMLKNILSENKKFLVANFDGKVLGLQTKGHISPIVAFDEKTDSVLILDVAGHKNGWYFARVSDLLGAMNTKDGEYYRGYLIIWK